MSPVVAETVEYRPYRLGDEQAIVQFLRECGYQPNDRSWRWINRGCPHGETIIELATVEDRVVGHYAVLPRWLQRGGKVLKAGLAIHAAVHPGFRGLAVLQELVHRILERCREEGLPFFYAFPKEKIWLMYSRVFQWKSMGELVALELPLEGLRLRSEDLPGIAFRAQALFDERYDRFEYSQGLGGFTFCIKDRQYLNWRYGCHPKLRYSLIEANTPRGGLAGYLILKLYEKQGIRYGHLIDLDVRPAFQALWPEMIHRALLEFCEQGVQVASCWMPEASPFFQALRHLGFQATGFSTTVGYRLVDPNLPVGALRLEGWHIVMGDSDAF